MVIGVAIILVLLVLHQELAELLFVDLDHAVLVLSFAFSFAFSHVLDFLDLVFDVLLSVHHWCLAVVFLLFDLDLLLHALDAIVVDFFFVLLFLGVVAVLLVVLDVDACLNALLLFEDLHVGSLLFGSKLIELIQVVLPDLSCIGKVSHDLEVVVGLLLLHRYELVELFFIHALETIILFSLSLTFAFSFLLAFGIFFAFFVDLFSFFGFTFAFNFLVFSFVTHLFFVHAFGNRSFLHERLASVLCWEVCSCEVETVIVVCRHEKFSLLVSEMLVWVVASLSEESDVSLKLLNLIKVVDESLRDLFDKEWPVGNLEFHVSL